MKIDACLTFKSFKSDNTDLLYLHYANKLNCAILLVKNKEIGYSLHYLAFGPTVQVLSWADSTMVLSAKVNFVLDTTVLITSIV